jgi:hypothetical protein
MTIGEYRMTLPLRCAPPPDGSRPAGGDATFWIGGSRFQFDIKSGQIASGMLRPAS